MKYSRLLFVGGGMLASVFAAFRQRKVISPISFLFYVTIWVMEI